MKKMFLLAASVLMGLTACQKEEDIVSNQGGTSQTLTVTIPQGVQTRATAEDYGKGTNVNRCILQIYRDGKEYGDQLVAKVENNQATFNLRLVAQQTYDFVFWADCATLEGETFTDLYYNTGGLTDISMKAAYTGNEDRFDAFTGKETMKVESAFNKEITLKRPFGQLNVKTLDIKDILDDGLKPTRVKVVFSEIPTTFNAKTGLVGKDTKAVEYTADVLSKDDGYLTIDYIWAPAEEEATLADFSMTFFNRETEISTNDAFKSIPIRRNHRTNVSGNLLTKQGDFTVTINPNFDEPAMDHKVTEVATVADVTEALKAGATEVIVKDAPKENATIIIPKADATKDADISITLPETSVSVTVKESTDGMQNVPASVSLNTPNTDNLKIELPSSTVTLNGNKYNTVEATTADNTLIIGSNVTVAKVIVKKGNVRVNKGATLNAIEKSTENQATTVIIYKENEAILPSSLEGFEVVDAAIADMKKVLADGGTYTLSNDMEGDFVVSAAASVTINLNGHKITNKVGDTFTVNHGSSLTVEGKGTVDNVTHAKACIYNNGTVVLNGGTYTRSQENGKSDSNSGGNSFYNILNHGEMTINQGVSVSQSGKFSSMIASGYYDYSNTNPRNGYVQGTNAAAPKLTINGGTFSGGLNTIKNDDGATLEIKGGTFDNMSQATVQNHHVATISGGTFNCSGAEYAVDNEGHSDAEKDLGDMTITGGTFNGKIYNVGDGADLKVTGGTFSDPGALKYLPEKEAANVKVALKADITAPGFITHDGQTVEINMNEHTLTLGNPTVGSSGTETNSCQLLEGSVVTFKNGTLASDNKDIVIQNYSKLHLQDMTLNTPNAEYSISNNNENCTLDNVTINAAQGDKKYAFDVYAFSSYEGVTVTVNSGTINGNVQFDGNNNKKNIRLIVNGGTFNGNLVVNEKYYDTENPNIIIGTNAQFKEGVTGWDKYK